MGVISFKGFVLWFFASLSVLCHDAALLLAAQ
jgi:hypothetical protein